jgi:redox-sensitive bicupin YhaK (pirin superfamily)
MITHLLHGHVKDLGGGMLVRRLLPAAAQRSVGPFVFFDHFGPVTVRPEDNHDVRAHPHIGLATVTYLFEGAMLHHDSLDFKQLIEPGAINLMWAGKGIVHAERRPPHLQDKAYVNHGLQLWLALPREQEEIDPGFAHTPAGLIPQAEPGDAQVSVLMGEALGLHSPVKTFSRTLYLDVKLAPGARWRWDCQEQELAIYPVNQGARINGEAIPAQQMAVVPTTGAEIVIEHTSESNEPLQLAIIGGDALDAPRFMWWNFVSSRKERIDQAAADWRAQRMGSIPGESEFIPLPEPGPR